MAVHDQDFGCSTCEEALNHRVYVSGQKLLAELVCVRSIVERIGVILAGESLHVVEDQDSRILGGALICL